MATFAQVLRAAAERLRSAGIQSANWDARMLLSHVLQVGHMDIPLSHSAEHNDEFDALITRREKREPLQHILGVAPFGPLDLAVGRGVFIPRPETETLADWAVRYLRDNFPSSEETIPIVVDLCTGSGALAAYIAYYRPDAKIWAVELSDDAMAFAKRNCEGTSVVMLQSDVTQDDVLAKLSEIVGQVDLIVTNPPYVPEDPNLEPEVYQDPHNAVFAGDDGMDVIKAMLPKIVTLLKPGGLVGIEHDDSTSDLVQKVTRQAGLVNVRALKDLAGVARFVLATKPVK